ncbi:MAG: hypothetical protein AAF335_01625 [Bacteroidota bacterium]
MEKIPTNRTHHPLLTKCLFTLALLCPLGSSVKGMGTESKHKIKIVDHDLLSNPFPFPFAGKGDQKVYLKLREGWQNKNANNPYEIDKDKTEALENNGNSKAFTKLLKDNKWGERIVMYPDPNQKGRLFANFDRPPVNAEDDSGTETTEEESKKKVEWFKQIMALFLAIPNDYVKDIEPGKTILDTMTLHEAINEQGKEAISLEIPLTCAFESQAKQLIKKRLNNYNNLTQKSKNDNPSLLVTTVTHLLKKLLEGQKFSEIDNRVKKCDKPDKDGNSEFSKWKNDRRDTKLKIKLAREKNESDRKKLKAITTLLLEHSWEIATGLSLIGIILIAAYFFIMFIYRQIMKIYEIIGVKEASSIKPSWLWHPMKRWRWERRPGRPIMPKKNIILTKAYKEYLDDYIEGIKDSLDYSGDVLTREDRKDGKGWPIQSIIFYGPTGSGKTLLAIDYIVGTLKSIPKYKDRVEYTIYSASTIASVPEEQIMETLKEDYDRRRQDYIDKAKIHFVIVNEGDLFLQDRYNDKVPSKMKAITVDFLDRYEKSRPDEVWVLTSNVIVHDLSQLKYMDKAALNRFGRKLFVSPFGKKKLEELTLEELQEVIEIFNNVFLVHLEALAIEKGVEKKGRHIKNYAGLRSCIENEFYPLISAYPSYREVRSLAEKIVAKATRKKIRAKRKRGGGSKTNNTAKMEISITEDQLREAFEKEKFMMKQKGIKPLNLEDYEEKEKAKTTVEKEEDKQVTINTKVDIIQKNGWTMPLILLLLFILISLLGLLVSMVFVQSPLWLSIKGIFKRKNK